MTVKTPCGETKPFTINERVLQGSVFGSIKCSVQVETLGREHLSDDSGFGLYSYKGMVEIPALGAVECG